MNRKDFLIILEQINSTEIKIDLYNFKFTSDSQTNEIKCQFDINDLSDKNALVQVSIQNDKFTKFSVETKQKKQQYSQEKFMALYNNEYNKLKQAYKKYKDAKLEEKYLPKKKEEQQKQILNDRIPAIKQFDTILNNKNIDNDIIQVHQKYLTFNFKQHSNQQYTNLYLCQFELPNKEYDDQDFQLPFKFLVTALLKIINQNAVFIKFIFVNPENTSEKFEINKQQFSKEYKKQFDLLQNAVNTFKKILMKQNKKSLD